MDHRFLFVIPVDEKDYLADIFEDIRSVASEMQCRCVMFCGTIKEESREPSGRSEAAAPLEASGEKPAIGESQKKTNNQESDQEKAVYRRKVLDEPVLSRSENWPTANDFVAVRKLISDISTDEARVLVGNSGVGEYAVAASQAPNVNIWCTIADDCTEFDQKVLDENIRTRHNIQIVPDDEVSVMGNQHVDAVVIVDPGEGDFFKYGRHLRLGGLLVLATSNGSSPDVPESLSDRVFKATDSVYWVYRKSPDADAPVEI